MAQQAERMRKEVAFSILAIASAVIGYKILSLYAVHKVIQFWSWENLYAPCIGKIWVNSLELLLDIDPHH